MLQPIGLALEDDQMAVMGDSVDDCGGHLVVGQHRAPAREVQVGGDHKGLPLVRPRVAYAASSSLSRTSLRCWSMKAFLRKQVTFACVKFSLHMPTASRAKAQQAARS